MAPTFLIGAVVALLALGLTVASIWATILINQFSLPAHVFGEILSIVLPILSFIGLLFPGFLIKPLVALQQPLILLTLGFFDTILLTLAATLLRSNLLTCELEQRWSELFQSKNVPAIRGIQDRLECCGLRTVLDQPWPFPTNHGATACRENYGRTRACEPAWRARQVEVLAIWMAVGIVGLVVKVVFMTLQQHNPSWVYNHERGRSWRFPRGTITDHAEGLEEERYQDQPQERATHRLPDNETENGRAS